MSKEGLIGACEILRRLEAAALVIEMQLPVSEVLRKPNTLAPGQKQLELFSWQEMWRDWRVS